MPQNPQREQQSPARQPNWLFGAPHEPSVDTGRGAMGEKDAAGVAAGALEDPGGALVADEDGAGGSGDGEAEVHRPYGACRKGGRSSQVK